jgi:hypothetical protein
VGTAASANRLFIEGSLGFAVDSHKKYNIGWNYSTQSTSDVANGKTATYSSSQMGPRFLIFLDRNNAWSLGFGYYLVSKASYDDGNGNSATWKGTAYKVDIGYNFPVTESLLAGIRMNYSGAKIRWLNVALIESAANVMTSPATPVMIAVVVSE